MVKKGGFKVTRAYVTGYKKAGLILWISSLHHCQSFRRGYHMVAFAVFVYASGGVALC